MCECMIKWWSDTCKAVLSDAGSSWVFSSLVWPCWFWLWPTLLCLWQRYSSTALRWLPLCSVCRGLAHGHSETPAIRSTYPQKRNWIEWKTIVNQYDVTWIFCRLDDASARFWGTSKHLAVLIFALTSHCWKSRNTARKRCSRSFSFPWHSRHAWRLRLRGGREMLHTADANEAIWTYHVVADSILFY